MRITIKNMLYTLAFNVRKIEIHVTRLCLQCVLNQKACHTLPFFHKKNCVLNQKALNTTRFFHIFHCTTYFFVKILVCFHNTKKNKWYASKSNCIIYVCVRICQLHFLFRRIMTSSSAILFEQRIIL